MDVACVHTTGYDIAGLAQGQTTLPVTLNFCVRDAHTANLAFHNSVPKMSECYECLIVRTAAICVFNELDLSWETCVEAHKTVLSKVASPVGGRITETHR